MGQKFIAREQFTFDNGAIGWRPGGPFDCLGPYAKVQNCPVHGTDLRLTCYATGYADTFFSVPACTRFKGRHISGFFTNDESGCVFHPHDKHKAVFAPGAEIPTPATRVFHAQAGFARNYGGSVDWDRSFGWVSIEWKGGDAFMQGDEASQFIADLDALCSRFPSLTPEVAALSLAWPIIETLGN